MLSIASFAIAAIGLIVSITTFLADSSVHPRIRVTMGIPFMLLAILFGLIGIFSVLGGNSSSGIPLLDTPVALNITPFCPFITQSQIEELKTIQGVDAALSKIREFSNDSKYWTAGEKIPANVVIATDLKTANYQTYNVIPINDQGGWGLFYTTQEITTPNDGAYWCVR